ncbi:MULTISPECIES: helix-turn-helix domain-containing protein [Streptomyces]|uniref:helix-turn-helix domain-containing protein n=1 Tax=Streptomyces TaxID=1883 RepID=UPI00069AA33F|nr:helix-turn-helix transcriptional regulator [Streptomyces sp. SID7805]MYU54923.1 helix-turn-helix domain-containing protein [Streptomyces sp. SID7805]
MAGNGPDRGTSISTVLGRRLGGELLRMREARGMRQAHAAEALTASVPKVAKMERGLVPMRDPDVRALCHLYGLDDAQAVDALLRLAKLDRERRKSKGWWDHSAATAPLAEYIAMENVASRIRTWQLAVVPGLFQTPEYTRALVAGVGGAKTPDAVDQIVEVRRRRQERLSGENPLAMHAVISEGALRQEVGGSATMRAQLKWLLELAELPQVRLQVLPFRVGAHPCLTGPFNIVSFAEVEAVDVVYMDTVGGTVWVENAEGSAQHSSRFDRIAKVSLGAADSATLVDSIRKGL